jgi:hypothetical protein
LRIHPTLTCPFQVPKREDIFNTEHFMTHLLLSSTLGQDEVFPFLHIESTISHISHLLLSSTLHQYKVFPFLHIQPTISHIVSSHTTYFSNKSLHCNTPTRLLFIHVSFLANPSSMQGPILHLVLSLNNPRPCLSWSCESN